MFISFAIKMSLSLLLCFLSSFIHLVELTIPITLILYLLNTKNVNKPFLISFSKLPINHYNNVPPLIISRVDQ